MFFKRTATAHGAHHVRAPGAVLCDAHLQRGTLSTGSHRFNRWIFLVVERSLRSMDFIYIYIFSHIFSSMLMYVIYHPRTELGVKSLKTCDLNLCTTYQWAALWTASDSGPKVSARARWWGPERAAGSLCRLPGTLTKKWMVRPPAFSTWGILGLICKTCIVLNLKTF